MKTMEPPLINNPKTEKQRASVHVWCRQVAKVLNDNAVDRKVLLERLAERGIDSAWTGDAFKAFVYKPVFQAVAAKQSTEEANTKDHDIVIQGLQKWCATEFGVVLPPFPDRFSQGEA